MLITIGLVILVLILISLLIYKNYTMNSRALESKADERTIELNKSGEKFNKIFDFDLYSSILSNINEMVFLTDDNGRVTYMNSSARAHYNLSKDSAAGIPLGFFWCGDSIDIINSTLELFREKKFNETKTLNSVCGDEIYELSITPIYKNGSISSFICVCRNATERKRAEEELRLYRENLEQLVIIRTDKLNQTIDRLETEITEKIKADIALKESETRFRSLVETTSDWIWQIDMKGRLSYTSPMIKDILGYDLTEVIGKSPLDYLSAGETGDNIERLKTIIKTRKSFTNLEYIFQHKNGQEVILETSGVPYFNQIGDYQGYQGINRDITGRKKIEQEREELLNKVTMRAKNLYCLFEISRLLVEHHGNLETIFSKTVQIIPPFWQYPEITCCRIIYNGKEFKTDDFQVTPWRLSVDIITSGNITGIIEVCYLREVAHTNNGLFTKEENDLIFTLRRLLGNIIEYNNIQEELRKREELISTIFNSIPIPMFMADPTNGQILLANQEASDFFQISLDDALSQKTINFYTDPNDREKVISKIMKNGFIKNYELYLKKGDGTPFFALLSSKLINIEGKNVLLSGIYDITNRKKAEEKLKLTMKKLKQAQEQLIQSEKLASLGQMLAGIAHEINNPINFIYSSLPSLRELINNISGTAIINGPENPRNNLNSGVTSIYPDQNTLIEAKKDLDDLLDVIDEGTGRITQIVKIMHQLARKSNIEMEPFDVNLCIESTLNLLNNQCGDSIEIIKDYSPDSFTVINTGLINQVFMNIIVNAIQAIDGKGEIRISTYRKLKNLFISIKDSGQGIKQENISKIFDPFFTTKSAGKGLGLGLSICYEIIKKHDGDITVKSEPGMGTEFLIKLPHKNSIYSRSRND